MTSNLRSQALPEIALDALSHQPLYAQLVQALRATISSGLLISGAKLPPSREAALQLGIGRNTVVDAYAELLADGLIETRGRAGSFVSDNKRLPRLVSSATSLPFKPKLTTRLVAANQEVQPRLDWRLGQACAQLLPINAWRTASKEAGRYLPPSGYGDPRGALGLRQAICHWLSKERYANYSNEQIVVTQGAGAAIDLLSALLLREGDVCAVEQPGYPRAAQAMQAAGAHVRFVPVDPQGMCVDQAFDGATPVLLHLTPSHQYPLGGRLSGARRRLLIQLIQRHRSLLIENEYDHEFIHEGQNHAPLAASLPEHALLVSTFAKAISPSLRLGFVAAPLEIANALAAKIEHERLHVSWPVQCSVQWLLQSGQLQKHLRRVRRYYAQLRGQLLLQLKKECPELRISGQGGGLHVVLRLATPSQTAHLLAQLRKQGVVFHTVKDFGGTEEALLLAYGHMTDTSLAECTATLVSAIQTTRRIKA
jgi:GntR family transcriptional regulator / MocR family aminotransferase